MIPLTKMFAAKMSRTHDDESGVGSFKRCTPVKTDFNTGLESASTPPWENTVNSNDFLSRGIEGNMEYRNFTINTVSSFAITNASPISKLYLKTVTNSKGTDLQRPKN